MKPILSLLFLSACAFPLKTNLRRPSSVMLENITYTSKLKLFAGLSMPSEIIIAKSLPNAPLKVEILDAPPEAHCKDSVTQEESSSFSLPSNIKGNYRHISCRLDPKDAAYPEMVPISVKFTVMLDDFEVSEEEYKTKKELLSYVDALDKGLTWSKELLSFAEGQLPLLSKSFSAADPKLQALFKTDEGEGIFVSVKSFSGSFKAKSFLSKKDLDVKGDKKNPKTIYSQYNEKSLVCGTGSNNGEIKAPLSGEGEIVTSIGARESFNCQFNFKRGEDGNSSGNIDVSYKAASFSSLRKSFLASVNNEEEQINRRIKSYHAEEFSKMTSNMKEIEATMASWTNTRLEVLKNIDQVKFTNFKNKTISELFPEEIKGTVGRSASSVQITPVKKIVYNESGEKQTLLYLNIRNSISYKIETTEFVSTNDRDLPFEEQVNLYLATSDLFKDQKGKKLIVCNDKIDAFYGILGHHQKAMNTAPNGLDQILNSLKIIAVESVASCDSSAKDKKEIIYARGKSKTDYIIQWSRKIAGAKETLSPIAVGDTYYSTFLASPLSADLMRNKSYSHPVFKKDFSLEIRKGQKDSFWVKEKDSYIERMDEESFIKIAY